MKKLLVAIILVFTLLSCLPLAVCAESDAETTAETVAELTTAEADEESVAETNDGPKTNFGFYPDSLKETLPVMAGRGQSPGGRAAVVRCCPRRCCPQFLRRFFQPPEVSAQKARR